jgi:hypothetical protein
LGRDGDYKLGLSGFLVPIWFADDLAFGTEKLLPVRGKLDWDDTICAARYDVAVEVEDHKVDKVTRSAVY